VAGKINTIHVKEGQQVESRELLLNIE